jgi:hypothetical protein
MRCTYKNNTEMRSRNHCWSGRGIGITYSECVSVTLSSSKAHAPYYNVICENFWVYHIFPHYLISGKIVEKKLLNAKFVF